MRRANDRPTTIYWLVDVRPETQQAVRSIGFPFYCGKTVDTPAQRLAAHRDAAKRFPKRLISQWLNACGEHVRVQVVATVPANVDWCAAEKRWIEVLRLHFPGGANITTGGQGAPGMVHTAEMRAKISAVHKGKIVSKATRKRISRASKGRKHSPESVERRAAKVRGTKRPNYRRRTIIAPNKHRMDRLADKFLAEREAKRIARKQARSSISS